ncbi:MAG: leucine-rich repeat domain-containing protein, partial [Oscillospiraceae bacterium]|nr:leucine-rich repeat domain-containing protein [Oscillospiraceae bacterium]
MKHTLRRTLSLLLALVLLCSAAPRLTLSACAEQSGYCGDHVSWTFNAITGELVISGTGQMANMSGGGGVPWYDLRPSVKTLTIENGVTSIGAYAFDYLPNLEEASIPDSIVSIGDHAFSSCSCLPELEIPGSVRSIGDSAFEYCESLQTLHLSEGVTSLGCGLLSHCESITDFTIPNSVTSLLSYAFFDCRSLQTITIGSGLPEIEGLDSLEGCDQLEAFYVSPDNPYLCSDSDGVLYNKAKTELLRCPPAFQGSYSISDGVISVNASAFQDCVSLTGIDIPASVASIGEYAFSNTGLTEATLPQGLTIIPEGAFCFSHALTEVNIPVEVTEIGFRAFLECGLVHVYIPANVAEIGYNAFGNSGAMKSITVDPANQFFSSDAEGVLFNKDKTVIIECPEGMHGSYTIPNGVTSIGIAFFNCRWLTSIVIPESVEEIGFYGPGLYYVPFEGYYYVPGFSVYGYPGSAAEQYANDFGFKFCPLGTFTDVQEGAWYEL